MNEETKHINEIEYLLEETDSEKETSYVYDKLHKLSENINNLYDFMDKMNKYPFQEEFNKINDVQNTEKESMSYIFNYIPNWIYTIYCNISNSIETYYGI